MEEKIIYNFLEGKSELKEILGKKGIGLANMTNLELPIPKGYTISSKASMRYYSDGMKISDEIMTEIYNGLHEIEIEVSKGFGNPDNPLLLSIRPGSSESMPDIADTVLNIGLNTEIAEKLALKNEKASFDSFRRLIQMYGSIVKKIDKKKFTNILEEIKIQKNVKSEIEFESVDFRKVVDKFKELYKKETGEDFPENIDVQFKTTIEAIYKCWNSDEYINYRKENEFSNESGIAINVQEMVFGNMDNNSGSGIAYSRNILTGENSIYGSFFKDEQAENTVNEAETDTSIERLKEINFSAYENLSKCLKILEKDYKDVQEVEYTLQDGRIYLLQTKNAKRGANAAIKIANDLLSEGIISEEEAVLKVSPEMIDELVQDENVSDDLFNNFMNLAYKYRNLKIRVNACEEGQVKTAYNYGAEGIGICKTEMLFLRDEDIVLLRKFLISENEDSAIFDKILNIQKEAFIKLYKEMKGYPVLIRLLDKSLYEFLPHEDETILKFASAIGSPFDEVKNKITKLYEFNTYMGQRGAKLLINKPEIIQLQVTAIMKAALQVNNEEETNIVPEILVPFISNESELRFIKNKIEEIVKQFNAENNSNLKCEIGAMIETPRAALVASEIAKYAKFFLFNLDELTQLTYGMSKCDALGFISKYYENEIIKKNIFEEFDFSGVGKLIKNAIDAGKQTRPDLKCGLYGEKYSDNPSTIAFCNNASMYSVACSPKKVPSVRLAAAQASILRRREKKS